MGATRQEDGLLLRRKRPPPASLPHLRGGFSRSHDNHVIARAINQLKTTKVTTPLSIPYALPPTGCLLSLVPFYGNRGDQDFPRRPSRLFYSHLNEWANLINSEYRSNRIDSISDSSPIILANIYDGVCYRRLISGRPSRRSQPPNSPHPGTLSPDVRQCDESRGSRRNCRSGSGGSL